ncbi:MAG: exodeoxyribonuclease VII large subunit [Alistipes sp.]|nr:exodeoxyribonuclease VII large subunit [Alistipes sp.]
MAAPQAFTLHQLQRHIKQTLYDQYPDPVWVVAEIAELKSHASGHCYLNLVEKGAREGVPKAQARAVIWRSHYPALSSYFEQETGQRLAVGLQIMASVIVTYHELYGFSLEIIALDASFTLGDMERQRRETILRLEEEGVMTMNQELELPTVVQRIAIISSAQAAGYQDFMKELGASVYRFETTLFEASMQGSTAEDSLIAALGEVADREEDFDVVVIIRGGGATSDLNCFNSYNLCNHIAQFPLPVITGIGHDKDQSVADLVAHTALKTPTATATWLVERMQQIAGWLADAALLLRDATRERIHSEELRLQHLQSSLRHESRERLLRERTTIELAGRQLPERIEQLLTHARQRLDLAAEVVASHSPQQLLRLGFAIVRSEGRALKRVEEIDRADQITIEVSDGIREVRPEKYNLSK